MEKINLEKVSPETRKINKQYSFRKACQAQRDCRHTQYLTSDSDRISSAYQKEGAKCLNAKKRGRKVGEKRQLTPVPEKEIQNIIIDRKPDLMKLSFMLWPCAAVCQLLQEKYRITITLLFIS